MIIIAGEVLFGKVHLRCREAAPPKVLQTARVRCKIKAEPVGELEITDLNRVYLDNDDLSVMLFDDNTKWIDAGTFNSLLESSIFVADEERKIGKKILCPEIIAYQKGFIDKEKIIDWISKNTKNEYFIEIKKEIEKS